MISNLSRFLSNLTDAVLPLQSFTKKDGECKWDQHHEEAFKKIKQIICMTPVLAYYVQQKELSIQGDYSRHGLGAVLLQDGRPIDYRSKTLTTTKTRYALIEKELLTIVLALGKFNH